MNAHGVSVSRIKDTEATRKFRSLDTAMYSKDRDPECQQKLQIFGMGAEAAVSVGGGGEGAQCHGVNEAGAGSP